jgi:hypothetical protein
MTAALASERFAHRVRMTPGEMTASERVVPQPMRAECSSGVSSGSATTVAGGSTSSR